MRHRPADKLFVACNPTCVQPQLRAGADAATCHAPLAGGEGRLSDDDLGLLVRYVNPVYLSEARYGRLVYGRVVRQEGWCLHSAAVLRCYTPVLFTVLWVWQGGA